MEQAGRSGTSFCLISSFRDRFFPLLNFSIGRHEFISAERRAIVTGDDSYANTKRIRGQLVGWTPSTETQAVAIAGSRSTGGRVGPAVSAH